MNQNYFLKPRSSLVGLETVRRWVFPKFCNVKEVISKKPISLLQTKDLGILWLDEQLALELFRPS